MTLIPGLQYQKDFIGSSQELELLSTLDQAPWLADLKRRVQHYGYRYDYKARKVTPHMHLGPIPEWLNMLCHRLHDDGYTPQVPDQVIVNEYTPGQGISAHIDCEPCFTDTIASVSIGSHCIMEFSHIETDEVRQLLLQPRSLLVMSGDARYQWRHAIPARKSDEWEGARLIRQRRVSLTFRNVII